MNYCGTFVERLRTLKKYKSQASNGASKMEDYRGKQLSPDELKFLKSEYESGTKVQDIADVMGISHGTVSKTAHKLGCQPRLVRDMSIPDLDDGDDIDKAIEAAERAWQSLDLKIKELKTKKNITFEYNDVKRTVTITGVDRFFRTHGGMAMFVEWFTKQFAVN